MKYVVFTRYAYFCMLWCNFWAGVDMLILYFDPVARHQWWFLLAALVQPVFGLFWLLATRQRKGFVRLTVHGDDYR